MFSSRFVMVSLFVCLSLFFGCIPDETLEWSSDGRVGLLRTEKGLFLVDDTGIIAPLYTGETTIGPALSAAGSRVGYVRLIESVDFDNALSRLPAGEVDLIKDYAARMRKAIDDTAGLVDKLPDIEDLGGAKLQFDDNWPSIYMYKNADKALKDRFSPEIAAELDSCNPGFCELVIADIEDNQLKNERIVTTSLFSMWWLKFSPDGGFLAYLVSDIEDDMLVNGSSLLIAPVDGGASISHISDGVAFGYDWHPDGKSVGYIKAIGPPIKDEDEIRPGFLCSSVVLGDDGCLLVGAESELALTIFSALAKVTFVSGDRILFQGWPIQMPTSFHGQIDLPGSIYCYDMFTRSVSDILPPGLSGSVGGFPVCFVVSPDGRRLILPGDDGELTIYVFEDRSTIPAVSSRSDCKNIDLIPSWKGSDRISCVICSDDPLLADWQGAPLGKQVLVLLDTAGRLAKVLECNFAAY